MNIQDIIDTDVSYEIMDDLPLSEHIEWNHYHSGEINLNELEFEQDDSVGNENLDFESD